MSSDDLFSVFQDDAELHPTQVVEVAPTNRSDQSVAERLSLKRKGDENTNGNSPHPKKQKIHEEKELILQVAEGHAAAEEKKKQEIEALSQETTLIECIHEVAYPPDWGM